MHTVYTVCPSKGILRGSLKTGVKQHRTRTLRGSRFLHFQVSFLYFRVFCAFYFCQLHVSSFCQLHVSSRAREKPKNTKIVFARLNVGVHFEVSINFITGFMKHRKPWCLVRRSPLRAVCCSSKVDVQCISSTYQAKYEYFFKSS